MCFKAIYRYRNDGVKASLVFLIWILTVIIYEDLTVSFTESKASSIKGSPSTHDLTRKESIFYKGSPLTHDLTRKESIFYKNQEDERVLDPSIPVIYLVTPTNTRLTQKVDLVRLVYALRQVPNIHWIMVEDWDNKTALVARILETSGFPYTHLHAASVKNKTTINKNGVMQRNAGLAWLRNNTDPDKQEGVVYFADDDNTYDVRLFDIMRKTQKVSVWPVALAGWCAYEAIRINTSTHKVSGFHVCWDHRRPFAVDMAAFAVNLRLIHQRPAANFYYHVKVGRLESTFIERLGITRDDLEPIANNFTEILVWHTKTWNKYPDGKALPPPHSPVLEV